MRAAACSLLWAHVNRQGEVNGVPSGTSPASTAWPACQEDRLPYLGSSAVASSVPGHQVWLAGKTQLPEGQLRSRNLDLVHIRLGRLSQHMVWALLMLG